MEALTVERSIWIAAPRERVWQAVTDPQEIAKWLLPPMLGAQMKRDDKNRLSVAMGPMEVAVVVFDKLDPPKLAASRTLPDRLLTTTYVLEEEKDGTRVTVALSGFESLPQAARQDRVNPTGEAWEKGLANLKAHVEGADLPFPEGYVAALSGYRRESGKTFAVERSIWIDASRERVWRAITDPDQMSQWFSPGTAWHMTGQNAGDRFFVKDPESDAEMYTQIIDKVDPPNEFITHSAPPEVAHVTTWTLSEENKGTRLTITYSGYEQDPAEGRGMGMEQNAFGFGMMLENIEAFVTGQALPYPGGF